MTSRKRGSTCATWRSRISPCASSGRRNLFQRADFLQHLSQRRPADPSYRVASVSLLKKATWFQPDQFAVAFHTVGDLQVADLEKYLTEHDVQSSAETSRDMLARVA